MGELHEERGHEKSDAGSPEGRATREAGTVDRCTRILSDRGDLDRALLENPNNAGAWNNLGVSYRVEGRPAVALSCYRRALALNPSFPAALGNLGNVLKDLGRYLEAVDAHRQALDSNPYDARAWHNLGIVFNEMGRAEEAERCFSRSLELDSSLIPIRFDRAIARLRVGDYTGGLEDFEARWSMPRAKPRSFTSPHWRGESLQRKRLLVHCEQGFGDNLLVTRFMRILKEKGATVIFECRLELVRLFRGFSDIDEVVAEGEPVPPHDLHCSSMSLMKLLDISLFNIPPPQRPAIPSSAKAKASSLLPDGAMHLRIGIVWSGSVTFEGNKLRCAQLEDFLSLYEVANVRLYSLQMAEPKAQLDELKVKSLVTDLTGSITDFADTAALIDRLDLVIMTDSAVAHLAGVLGKPIWNLLQEVPYWIYGLAGEHTAWYPTMRLIRRRDSGSWAGVFRQVVERLRNVVRAKQIVSSQN